MGGVFYRPLDLKIRSVFFFLSTLYLLSVPLFEIRAKISQRRRRRVRALKLEGEGVIYHSFLNRYGPWKRLVGWLYPVSPTDSRHWLRCYHGIRARRGWSARYAIFACASVFLKNYFFEIPPVRGCVRLGTAKPITPICIGLYIHIWSHDTNRSHMIRSNLSPRLFAPSLVEVFLPRQNSKLFCHPQKYRSMSPDRKN